MSVAKVRYAVWPVEDKIIHGCKNNITKKKAVELSDVNRL
jgi:hypothetical protein